MVTIVGEAQQTSVERVTEDDERDVRVFRDGAVVKADWIEALILEGRVHGVNTGTGTTPEVFNPIYADAEQDLYIHVPAGTVIIPLYIGLNFEDTGTAVAANVFAAYSSNGNASVTGETPLTIYNYKTLASPSSACTATPVVTSGTTHEGGTDFLEFWRPYAGFIADEFDGSTAWLGGGSDSPHYMHWSAKTGIAPVIGSAGTDCALSIFAGVTAGTGFLTVVWAELDAADVA